MSYVIAPTQPKLKTKYRTTGKELPEHESGALLESPYWYLAKKADEYIPEGKFTILELQEKTRLPLGYDDVKGLVRKGTKLGYFEKAAISVLAIAGIAAFIYLIQPKPQEV